MQIKHLKLPIFAAASLLFSNLCRAEQMTVTTDKTNGIYQVGEPVHWHFTWQGTNDAPPARFKLLQGGFTEAGGGSLNFTNAAAEVETSAHAPGTLLMEAKWKSEDGKEHRDLAGAVVSPDRITLSAPRPDDFDEFWNAKLKELAAVPANPKLESVAIGNTNLAYWKISLDNIRSTHIQGQLARPESGEKFPALLIVQWAGVYPLQKSWATDRAKEGWLVLNILAHDLPIDRPESFYQEQSAGPLKDYPSIGNDDRDTSYFLRMYLSCYRAAEYLTQREDWDGQTLAVMGGSQGGLQALMTAGLHPKVTAALANVPAGCDMLGPDAGRAPGWPNWYAAVWGKDAVKVHAASRYFDIANFTPHIKCPVLIGLGLIDEVCPPAGIFAAANQITSPKEIIVLPTAEHMEIRGSHGAYYRRCFGEWLPVLVKGKPAPVK